MLSAFIVFAHLLHSSINFNDGLQKMVYFYLIGCFCYYYFFQLNMPSDNGADLRFFHVVKICSEISKAKHSWLGVRHLLFCFKHFVIL